MLNMIIRSLVLLGMLQCSAVLFAQNSAVVPGSKLTDPSFFPICVWVQAPQNAAKYKAAGINTFVGLWRGPTDEQLAVLKAAGMNVICAQNETGLRHKDDPTIIAWMHGDEPDNAQSKRGGGGYDPPILPEKIVEGYKRMKERDPSRLVLLNMGQGVAWDDYIGRGVRRRHPEDYPEYIKGCDIATFDIYPAVHDSPAVAGNLWYVAKGVERLHDWSGAERRVWNCIEASRISNEKTKPTADQIKAEVWMSIIHGSRGIIYFVHQFKPRFVEASLLEDPDLLRAVTAINSQVSELAPVINSPAPTNAVEVKSSNPEVPLASMTRQHGDATYLFVVSMRGQETKGTFTVPGVDISTAETLGEYRKIPVRNGRFEDSFASYGVHLYRIR